MTLTSWLQFAALIAVLAATARPLGRDLAAIYTGGKAPGDRVFLPVERLIYRVARVDAGQEQRWTTYAFAVLGFGLVSFLVVYLLQRAQAVLPLNPVGLPAVPENVAFNTAVSFLTNTNWQAYAGESTMSHLTQMLALGVIGMATFLHERAQIDRNRQGLLKQPWIARVIGSIDQRIQRVLQRQSQIERPAALQALVELLYPLHCHGVQSGCGRGGLGHGRSANRQNRRRRVAGTAGAEAKPRSTTFGVSGT